MRQANVYRLLDTWDEATRNGDSKPVCDALTPDVTYSIRDHVGAQLHERSGSRDEFCDYLDKFMPVMAKKMTSYGVTREHYTATRGGMLLLSAEVSYTEHEDIVFTDGMHIKQNNEIHLTIKSTLEGLRVTHFEGDNRVAPPGS